MRRLALILAFILPTVIWSYDKTRPVSGSWAFSGMPGIGFERNSSHKTDTEPSGLIRDTTEIWLRWDIDLNLRTEFFLSSNFSLGLNPTLKFYVRNLTTETRNYENLEEISHSVGDASYSDLSLAPNLYFSYTVNTGQPVLQISLFYGLYYLYSFHANYSLWNGLKNFQTGLELLLKYFKDRFSFNVGIVLKYYRDSYTGYYQQYELKRYGETTVDNFDFTFITGVSYYVF